VIALDTNVLVRLLLRDDEAQAAQARELFEANAGIDAALFVSDVVLAELAWVLRSRYALATEPIARAVRALLDDGTLAWQSRAAVAQALQLCTQGRGDFAHCLIVALAGAHGCEATATFDSGMQALPGVRVMRG
jgi:predicted nucleic-acid-binding protein